jgi:hypothetical protein
MAKINWPKLEQSAKLRPIQKSTYYSSNVPANLLHTPKRLTYQWDSHIGVYGVFCNATNSVYIGQSKNVPTRMRNHRMNLKNGVYRKNHLWQMQSDYDKHGEESFRYLQIAQCNEEQLLSLETQYCVQYHTDGYTLYNGYIHTESTGLYCPKPFEPIITRIIKLLDRGRISLPDLERGIDAAEGGGF